MNLTQKEKKDLYLILEKYDEIYPNLGNSVSKLLQGLQEREDILTIFNHLDPETLSFDDFVTLNDILNPEIRKLLKYEYKELEDSDETKYNYFIQL
jgi:hypothetical protein